MGHDLLLPYQRHMLESWPDLRFEYPSGRATFHHLRLAGSAGTCVLDESTFAHHYVNMRRTGATSYMRALHESIGSFELLPTFAMWRAEFHALYREWIRRGWIVNPFVREPPKYRRGTVLDLATLDKIEAEINPRPVRRARSYRGGADAELSIALGFLAEWKTTFADGVFTFTSAGPDLSSLDCRVPLPERSSFLAPYRIRARVRRITPLTSTSFPRSRH